MTETYEDFEQSVLNFKTACNNIYYLAQFTLKLIDSSQRVFWHPSNTERHKQSLLLIIALTDEPRTSNKIKQKLKEKKKELEELGMLKRNTDQEFIFSSLNYLLKGTNYNRMVHNLKKDSSIFKEGNNIKLTSNANEALRKTII